MQPETAVINLGEQKKVRTENVIEPTAYRKSCLWYRQVEQRDF